MRNQVQLIAYADRLGGSLAGLTDLLRGPLAGLFGGVHVLPFFRPYDGADAGFDPADHTEVDARLGTWDDVAELADTVDVMADLIVNHVSRESPQFRDVLRRGQESPYTGMFLTLGSVFPDGATEEQLLEIYRPRPGLPFTPVRLDDGTRRIAWTTFTPQQLDVDVDHAETRRYLASVLDRFGEAGIEVVRLDAVGYAVKTPGTSCFLTPETFAFIDDLSASADERGMEVLVEVHSHYQRQLEIADKVDFVYDFALPPLVLHALTTGNASRLVDWLEMRPRNAVTVLDTHDGIGVLDVGADSMAPDRPGLLTPQEIDDLVERIHDNSDGQSRRATGEAASNVDLYQVNCTYYDALARDDQRYLAARLLQVFAPGIPQIYYVGLFASTNDMALLESTGVGRDINRHYYERDELEHALQRPVVQRLCSLLRFRNRHPAFDGEWHLGAVEGSRITMGWTKGDDSARVTVDVADGSHRLEFSTPEGTRAVTDLLDV